MAEQSLPRTDTGNLRSDLRANARLVVGTLTDPRQSRLFKALIAASLCNDQAAQALHHFYAVRVEEWAGCVRDAVARGEIPAGTDPHAVIAAVSAPLYYAFLNSGLPLGETDADRAADAATTAAHAGVWTRQRAEGAREGEDSQGPAQAGAFPRGGPPTATDHARRPAIPRGRRSPPRRAPRA